jgi:hypothetical protein
MCFFNRHTFTWGSSITFDAMPLSLRCSCGAMSREDIGPVPQLQAENERLRAALTEIRDVISGTLTVQRPLLDVVSEIVTKALSETSLTGPASRLVAARRAEDPTVPKGRSSPR